VTYSFTAIDVLVLIMLTLGGMRTTLGPVVGALVVVYINEVLASYPHWRLFIFGVLLIHGLVPGPGLLVNNMDVIAPMFAALFVAATFVFLSVLAFGPYYIWLARMNRAVLYAFIAMIAMVGTYASSFSIFQMWVALFIGLFGLPALVHAARAGAPPAQIETLVDRSPDPPGPAPGLLGSGLGLLAGTFAGFTSGPATAIAAVARRGSDRDLMATTAAVNTSAVCVATGMLHVLGLSFTYIRRCRRPFSRILSSLPLHHLPPSSFSSLSSSTPPSLFSSFFPLPPSLPLCPFKVLVMLPDLVSQPIDFYDDLLVERSINCPKIIGACNHTL
jgi:MFS family permease